MLTLLKYTLRIIIGVALLLLCLKYSFLAYQTDTYIQPQIDRSGSLLDQARSASKVALGERSINLDFLKYVAVSLVAGILFLVTILGGEKRGALSPASRQHYISDTEQLKRTQQQYKHTNIDFSKFENYVIAFDTNILLDKPDLIMEASQFSNIVISKQVIKELDGKNKEESTLSNALHVFVYLDKLHASGQLLIVNYKLEDMRAYDLDEADADQRIIGAYLGAQKNIGRSILFVSRDRSAKIYARNAGLQVYEF